MPINTKGYNRAPSPKRWGDRWRVEA
jgi:hypothetical protein